MSYALKGRFILLHNPKVIVIVFHKLKFHRELSGLSICNGKFYIYEQEFSGKNG